MGTLDIFSLNQLNIYLKQCKYFFEFKETLHWIFYEF